MFINRIGVLFKFLRDWLMNEKKQVNSWMLNGSDSVRRNKRDKLMFIRFKVIDKNALQFDKEWFHSRCSIC